MKEKLQEIYWEIANRSRYNANIAAEFTNEMVADDILTPKMLENCSQLLEIIHLGDSLYFSIYLIMKLKKAGISSFLLSVQAETQSTCSERLDLRNYAVAYYDETNKIFVADIAKDIKKLTDFETESGYSYYNPVCRNKLELDPTQNLTISLETFKKENPNIKSYPDIFDFKGRFFTNFLSHGKPIR